METAKKVVLVPWDFTSGCENALKHAVQLASVAGNEIMLLHIIPKFWWQILGKSESDKQLEVEELKRKLEIIAEKINNEQGFTPITMVLEGNPSALLSELITTANINLIVAGKTYTHAKNIYDSSSFLRKISIKNASVPFIVTEAPPLHTHYIEIVVPLDYDKKYKETLHWIIYLSKYYKCNINLIKPFVTDEGKKKDMANNIYFTKKMLDGNKIIYGIKTAKRQNSFKDEVFKFANNIDADLILIMADKYNNYIQNKDKSSSRVPIMCITPRLRKFQGFY
jgi:nucleotide-binding universal stress UspA family protein